MNLLPQVNKNMFVCSKISAVLGLVGIMVGVIFLVLPSYLFFSILVVVSLQSIIIKRIEYGYYLTILFIPVERVFLVINYQNEEFNIYPHIFFLTLTLLSRIIAPPSAQLQKNKDLSIAIVLFAIMFFEALSLLWTQAETLGSILVLSLFYNFYLFLISGDMLRDEASLKRLTHVLVIIGIIVATGVILSQWYDFSESVKICKHITLKVAFGEIASRAAGFGGPAHSAGFLMLPIFILIGKILGCNKWMHKCLHAIILGYLVVGFITTASRGGLVGMIGGIFLLFLLHPLTQKKIVKYSMIIIFLMPLTILIAKPSYIDRLLVGFGYTGQLYFSEGKTTQATTDTEKEETAGGMKQRKSWWKKAIKEMVGKPYTLLVGLGVGAFIEITGAIGTHSVPLSFFFDIGLIGIIIFIFLVLILYEKIRYCYHYSKRTYSYYFFICLVAAFVGDVGLHGLIDYDLTYYPSKMFWFPLGFVVALLNVMSLENPDFIKVI